KSKKSILVGYEANGYRLWDAINGKFFTARDVVVDESNMVNSRAIKYESFPNDSKENKSFLNDSKESENVPNDSTENENIPNESKENENILNESKDTENILNESKDSENILNESKESENILNESKECEEMKFPNESKKRKQVDPLNESKRDHDGIDNNRNDVVTNRRSERLQKKPHISNIYHSQR
ncbi:hypothetical protein KR054_009550, partial [Drosophila jambulina]